MRTRDINSPDVFEPSSGYSQAIEASQCERWLFISGQVPIDLDGNVPGDFATQCELVWQSLAAQLNAADMDVSNLLKITIFLPSRENLKENTEIRRRFCGDHKPALTLVFASMYDDDWLLEIEATAAA